VWKLVIVGVAMSVGLGQLAGAKPLMVVTCSAPQGINLASDVESDKPKDAVSPTFDATAGGYVSHPGGTHGSIITINRDGTATDTLFLGDGKSVVSEMHIVGKINETAISFTEGVDGSVILITLYPKESLMLTAATAYFGLQKAIPTGSVYISRCEFSRVLP
jgi:hypothetical protein